MEVRSLTVGPVQENCHIARLDGGAEAVVIDPGDEGDRLLEAIEALEVEVAAILLTHTHFDHVGAVAPVARATGAETLRLAGLEIEVLFTPGHSPGHVSYWIPAEQALFSGDVLFAGSIGRT